MEEFLSAIYGHFLNRIDQTVGNRAVINEARISVDPLIEDIPVLWVAPFYEFLHYEPQTFWNRKICDSTFQGLEKLASISDNFAKTLCKSLNYYTMAYFAYQDIIQVMNKLEPLNEDPEIKTRMYRIPTYVGIVEGCISQLYKLIRDLIDITVDKDLKSQTKLNGLWQLMNTYGFEALCEKVDVDIRNAINHGGILLTKGFGDKVSFFYSKKGIQEVKELDLYMFDQLIEGALDNASGIIMGFLRFFSRYPEVLLELDTYSKEDLLLGNSLARLHLSFPGTRCAFISTVCQAELSQINLEFITDIVRREELTMFSLEVACITRISFPEYKQYYMSFRNERMLPGWIRYHAEEIDSVIGRTVTMTEVVQSALDRGDLMIFDPSDENVNVDLVKYHRFPVIDGDGWRIRDIKDCSLPNLKRLKGCLYLGNIQEKRKIVRVVNDAIRKMKVLYNPPQLAVRVKHGEMHADAVYLNVYFRHNRAKDRELLPSNKNFVLTVQYNSPGTSPLRNGGLPEWLWESLNKEQVGNILYAWNSGVEDFA